MQKKKNTKAKNKKAMVEEIMMPVVEEKQRFFATPAGRSALSVVALVAVFVLLSAGWVMVGWRHMDRVWDVRSDKSQATQKNKTLETQVQTLQQTLADLQKRMLALEQTTIPLITVSEGSGIDVGHWVVYQNGRKVASIEQGEGGEEPSLYLVKQTLHNAYLGFCPGGLGGYYVFEACPYGLTRFDLKTHELTDLTPKDLLIFGDVSPDEQWVAWRDSQNRVIVLRNVKDGTEKKFSVSQTYGQFGNIHFSPDGTKIAYGAARSNPENEMGYVVVLDIAKGTQTVIAQTEAGKNASYTVYGWIDNDKVDYE